MSEQHTLAIIIPYYKYTFFEQCLDSIYNQTNKNFTLYIFDDASPKSPIHLLRKLDGVINYHYHKFEKNLGGTDLVAHWNRCVQLTSESWIWLFGDDDYMSPKCVESFFNEISLHYRKSNVYRIPVSVIDELGNVIWKANLKSNETTMLEVIQAKLKSKAVSFVVEYIFSRKVFDEFGGFYSLPLAWGADDISWLIFTKNSLIFSLQNSQVYWRLSKQNISSNSYENYTIKLNSLMKYGNFLKKYVSNTTKEHIFKSQFKTDLYRFIKIHLFNVLMDVPVLYSVKYSIILDFSFRRFPTLWLLIIKQRSKNYLIMKNIIHKA